jgi:hypothetical protein
MNGMCFQTVHHSRDHSGYFIPLLTLSISSGWDCLRDSAQIGIILIAVTVVLALGCVYWRLKVKPNLQNGLSDNRAPVNGYWEFTRRNPDQVSITIYREPREPRSLSNPEIANTERQASRRGNGDDEAIQQENTTSRAPIQLGMAGTSDIHLVPPPPPPPVLWTAAPPSVPTIPTTPPPPPFGPPTFLAQAPPPAPLHPYPHGLDTAAFACAPDAPPPYLNYAAPQTFQGQTPGLGNVASGQAQPTWAPPQAPPMAAPMATPMVPPSAPPPPRAVAPQKNNTDKTTQAAPPIDNPVPRRRWFSLGIRVPTPGHARTLSNSSTSTVARSTSTSPPASSVSPPRRSHERRHLRRHLKRRSARHQPARQAPQPRQSPRNKTQSQHHHDASSPSASSADSSYLNTSADVVHDNHEPYPGFRHHARRSSYPERHRRQSTKRETRLVPSQSAPHQQRPPSSQGTMRPPSPDIQYPSPEPRRPRVSFTLPTDSDGETGSSAPASRYPRRSNTRSHRSWQESHGGNRDSRRGPPQQRREQTGLADRITGAFYSMRRALRGDD